HQDPAILLFDKLADKYSVFPNDGRRVAGAGQLHPPADVLLFTPLDRKVLFRSYTVALGTTPGRPIAESRTSAGQQARAKDYNGAFHECVQINPGLPQLRLRTKTGGYRNFFVDSRPMIRKWSAWVREIGRSTLLVTV